MPARESTPFKYKVAVHNNLAAWKKLPSYHVSHMYHLNTEHVVVNMDIWVVASSPLVYL